MTDQPPDQLLNRRVARLNEDLRNLVQVIVDGLNKRLSPYDINAVEYTLLSICLAAGPITIKDLREVVPIDSAHMSRTLSSLEDRRLVQKVRPKHDRRLISVTVTEEGRALMPELMKGAQEFYTLLVKDISQERLVGCMAIMEKMIADGGELIPSPAASSHEPNVTGAGRTPE